MSDPREAFTIGLTRRQLGHLEQALELAIQSRAESIDNSDQYDDRAQWETDCANFQALLDRVLVLLRPSRVVPRRDVSKVSAQWLDSNPEFTCGCGLYVHPSRRTPGAIHIPDCPWAQK